MTGYVATRSKMDVDGDLASAESKYAQRPSSTKRLRACKHCKLIKNEEQFAAYGCDNCGADHDSKAAKREWMESNTTDDFEG